MLTFYKRAKTLVCLQTTYTTICLINNVFPQLLQCLYWYIYNNIDLFFIYLSGRFAVFLPYFVDNIMLQQRLRFRLLPIKSMNFYEILTNINLICKHLSIMADKYWLYRRMIYWIPLYFFNRKIENSILCISTNFEKAVYYGGALNDLLFWLAWKCLFWGCKQGTQKRYCKQIYNLLPE